mgnify:CR=1 FL=1
MQRKNSVARGITNASAFKIGIVVSAYYADEITEKLLTGALEVLQEAQVLQKNIAVLRVPGCFEIPYGCLKLLTRKGKQLDAIITLGCVIKGETDHNVYIATAVTEGVMRLMLEFETPIAFGIITANNLAQAKARTVGEKNKGYEAALAALGSLFAGNEHTTLKVGRG